MTSRLVQATRGVGVITHAAANKQVPAWKYKPFDAAQTNLIGAETWYPGDRERGAAYDCSVH